MVLFPDVQQKAQAEIDSVVGTGRLPTFADQPYLPYVNAVVTEVLRWNSVGPLGIYCGSHTKSLCLNISRCTSHRYAGRLYRRVLYPKGLHHYC